MKKILAFLALSAALVVPSHASVIYTSAASLLANITGETFTNDFDGLTNPAPGAASFTSGIFSYSIFAPSDLYASGDFLGTSLPDEDLTITFTSGNVYAFGANFFAVDLSDTFQPVSLTLTLSDGTIETFTPTSISDSYRGFLSNVAIASFAIGAPVQSLYAGLDNLTVGTVPEPTSWALLGLGLAGFVVARRRAV